MNNFIREENEKGKEGRQRVCASPWKLEKIDFFVSSFCGVCVSTTGCSRWMDFFTTTPKSLRE